MAVLTFPAIRNPNSVRFALAANSQSGGRSPFDGTEQTLALPGDRWTAELRWNQLPETQWRLMQAFIAQLRGRAGRFTWGPTHMPRRGTNAGGGGLGPRCNTGSGGTTLYTKGWATGGAPAFLAGDMLGYTDPAGRTALHMAVTNVVPDGSGLANFIVSPAIRRAPNTDAVLNLTNPTAVWRLMEDDAGLEYERGVYASVSLKIEEAIF